MNTNGIRGLHHEQEPKSLSDLTRQSAFGDLRYRFEVAPVSDPGSIRSEVRFRSEIANLARFERDSRQRVLSGLRNDVPSHNAVVL
jgi:hypothetical protein